MDEWVPFIVRQVYLMDLLAADIPDARYVVYLQSLADRNAIPAGLKGVYSFGIKVKLNEYPLHIRHQSVLYPSRQGRAP